jgi:hypothetical protein
MMKSKVRQSRAFRSCGCSVASDCDCDEEEVKAVEPSLYAVVDRNGSGLSTGIPTIEDAREYASRQARKFPGSMYFILGPVEVVQSKEIPVEVSAFVPEVKYIVSDAAKAV